MQLRNVKIFFFYALYRQQASRLSLHTTIIFWVFYALLRYLRFVLICNLCAVWQTSLVFRCIIMHWFTHGWEKRWIYLVTFILTLNLWLNGCTMEWFFRAMPPTVFITLGCIRTSRWVEDFRFVVSFSWIRNCYEGLAERLRVNN